MFFSVIEMYFNLWISKFSSVTSWEGNCTLNNKPAHFSIDWCFRPSLKQACVFSVRLFFFFFFNCQSQPLCASVQELGGREARWCTTWSMWCAAASSLCPGCEMGVRGLLDCRGHPVSHGKFPCHNQAEMDRGRVQWHFRWIILCKTF